DLVSPAPFERRRHRVVGAGDIADTQALGHIQIHDADRQLRRVIVRLRGKTGVTIGRRSNIVALALAFDKTPQRVVARSQTAWWDDHELTKGFVARAGPGPIQA